MPTSRDIRRQARAAIDQPAEGCIQRFDVDAIVSAIENRYGLVDISTMAPGEFEAIVAEHDAIQQVVADAANRLQEARSCLAAEWPDSRDERLALAERFRKAVSGLGDLGVLHMTVDAGPDENLDMIMRHWAFAWAAPENPERAKAREALAALFAKLEERIGEAADGA